MQKFSLIIICICFFVINSCGSNNKKENSDINNNDTIPIADTIDIITAHPDTIFQSTKLLKVIKIDTFAKNISGILKNFDNQYHNTSNILTFRGNPSRETSFSGKVTGTPSIVKVDWIFNTGNGVTARWGGGSGWTGQPLYVKWTEEQVKRLKSEAKEFLTPNFSNEEIIISSLAGKVFFINFETGEASRKPYNVINPIKGTASIHPSMNGNMFVGQGIPDTVPFGALVFNLYNHKEVSFFNKDKNAWRGWGAYDSSPIAVGQFMFRPGENGTVYKLYCKGDSVLLHSTLRYKNGKGNGGIESSMAIHRNYGYFADNEGFIICINLNNLKPVWVHHNYDDTDATIVVTEENGNPYVYTGCEIDSQGENGFSWFTKLNGITGQQVWSTQIEGKCLNIGIQSDSIKNVKKVEGGMFSTPLIGHGDCEGLIFSNFCIHKPRNLGEFIAFDCKTGKIIYRTTLKQYSWTSPIAIYNENNELFVFTGDTSGNVYLIRGKTGEIIYTSHIGSNFESSPIIIGNKVVCGSRGTKIYKMSIE